MKKELAAVIVVLAGVTALDSDNAEDKEAVEKVVVTREAEKESFPEVYGSNGESFPEVYESNGELVKVGTLKEWQDLREKANSVNLPIFCVLTGKDCPPCEEFKDLLAEFLQEKDFNLYKYSFVFAEVDKTVFDEVKSVPWVGFVREDATKTKFVRPPKSLAELQKLFFNSYKEE